MSNHSPARGIDTLKEKDETIAQLRRELELSDFKAVDYPVADRMQINQIIDQSEQIVKSALGG